LQALPPLVVYIGDRDILRPAVDALADRARRVDAELYVHEVTAMFHVWMTRAIPEGRRTRRELANCSVAGAPGPDGIALEEERDLLLDGVHGVAHA
jgi:epsilon-lactone hydrolase